MNQYWSAKRAVLVTLRTSTGNYHQPVLVGRMTSTGSHHPPIEQCPQTLYTEYPSLSKRIPIPPFHYTIRRRGDKFSPLKKKAPQLE